MEDLSYMSKKTEDLTKEELAQLIRDYEVQIYLRGGSFKHAEEKAEELKDRLNTLDPNYDYQDTEDFGYQLLCLGEVKGE